MVKRKLATALAPSGSSDGGCLKRQRGSCSDGSSLKRGRASGSDGGGNVKKQRGERGSLTPRRDLLVPKVADRPKTAEPIRKKGRHVKVRTVVSSDDEEEEEQNDGSEQEEEEDEEEQNDNEDSAEDSDSEQPLHALARRSQQNVSRHETCGFDQVLEDGRNCSECGLILKDDQPRYRTCRSPPIHPSWI